MGKKKKNKGYDFDAEYQEKMMREIDELLYGSGTLPEQDDSDDIMSAITNALNCETESNYDESHNDRPKRYAYMASGSSVYDDEDESDILDLDEIVNDPIENSISNTSNFVKDIDSASSINMFYYSETKIFMISDDARKISIDLNLLEKDDSDELSEDSLVDLFAMTLLSSLSNMYPSAIISNARLNNTFKNITEINEGKFIFFNCPYKPGMSLVYYISDESWGEIHDAIQEAVDLGCAVSLINSIRNVLELEGISFRNTESDLIDLLIANNNNTKSCNAIIGLINNDEGTFKSDDVNNDSFTSVVHVSSFIPDDEEDDDEYDSEDESSEYEEDDDEYNEDESDDEPENVEVKVPLIKLGELNKNNRVYSEQHENSDEDIPETVIENDDVDDDVEEVDEITFDSKSESKEAPVNTVESEESVDTSDNRVEVPPIEDDDSGEIDLGGDSIDDMDHEDAEKYWFGNKPAPRESMKSSKQQNNNSMIIKRQHRK